MTDHVLSAAADGPGAVPRRLHADTARLALFAALSALALVPVATTPIPAMVDYLNHLARMYELAAPTSPYYHAAWKLYPNLAMDLIVPILARWTGVEMAGRLFLLASQILVVTGAIAIELRVKRRFESAGFVALLYLFNVPFAWGFLNFEFAMGVALWGIAAWLAVREAAWPIRFVVNAIFVVALFAGHLFALGLYGVTLGLHETWAQAWAQARAQAWAAGRTDRPVRRVLATGLLLAAPVVALAIVMAATGSSVGGSDTQWQAVMKPLWPVYLLNGDSTFIAMCGTAALAWLVRAMVIRRELAFVASGVWLAVGFGVLYLVIPGSLLGTQFVDIRVLVGAVMILPAFVSVTFASPRGARIAAAVVGAVTLANIVVVERVWSSYQPVYRDMIASFAELTPRSRVLVAHAGEAGDPPIGRLTEYPLYHAPTLAVHYAGAFVPSLFTTAGKQPLTVVPEMRRLAFSDGGPVPLSVLAALAKGGPITATAPAFLEHWPSDFDYVYILGTLAGETVPDVLQLVERRPGFALYRTREPGSARGLRP